MRLKFKYLRIIFLLALFFNCLFTFERIKAATFYIDSTCATPGDGSTSVCSGATAPFDQLEDADGAVTTNGDTIYITGTFSPASLVTINGGTWIAYGAGAEINSNGLSIAITVDLSSIGSNTVTFQDILFDADVAGLTITHVFTTSLEAGSGGTINFKDCTINNSTDFATTTRFFYSPQTSSNYSIILDNLTINDWAETAANNGIFQIRAALNSLEIKNINDTSNNIVAPLIYEDNNYRTTVLAGSDLIIHDNIWTNSGAGGLCNSLNWDNILVYDNIFTKDNNGPGIITINGTSYPTVTSASVYDNSFTVTGYSAAGGALILGAWNMASPALVYDNTFTGYLGAENDSNHAGQFDCPTSFYRNKVVGLGIGMGLRDQDSTGLNLDLNHQYGIYNNIFINQQGVVIAAKGQDSAIIYNNSFYQNRTSSSIINGASSVAGWTTNETWIKNNAIEYTDASAHPVDFYLGTDHVSNYNLFWNGSETDTGYIFANADGHQAGLVATWQALGYDTNSIIDDPDYTSTSTNSLSLLSTSPAIDAGTNVGLTADYLGNPIYGTPDIGAYEYQPPYTAGTNDFDVSSPLRIYSNGKFRYTSATGTGATSTVADFNIAPSSGWPLADYSSWMDITVKNWSTSSTYYKKWIETSATSSIVSVHTIGDLGADTYYTVLVDSVSLGNYLSNGSGQITFTYNGGYSIKTFEVTERVYTPSSVTVTPNSASHGATVSWSANSNPAGTYYYVENITEGTNSGWITDTSWISSGLSCGDGASYNFRVKAKNRDAFESDFTTITSFENNSGCSGGGSATTFSPPIVLPETGNGSTTVSSNGPTSTLYNFTNQSFTKIEIPAQNINSAIVSIVPKDSAQVQQLTNNASMLSANTQIVSQLVADYSITSNGIAVSSFSKPLTITFQYTDQEVQDYKEETLKIFWYNEQDKKWEALLNNFLDMVNNKVAASVNHLSLFALMGEKKTAIVSESAFKFTKYLYSDYQGPEVKKLQELLKKLKFYSGKIGGYYGALTRKAVIKFQRANKISPVGTVGPKTRAALNKKL